jgi:hypothetical protein
MKQLYRARGSRQVKQPVPTAVNEGNHMEKMRAVLIGMVLAAAQVAPAPVSADVINTFQNVRTKRCMDDSHLGFRTVGCHFGDHQRWIVRVWVEDGTRQLRNVKTGRCIGDNPNDGGFRTFGCDSSRVQSWFIKRYGDGIHFQNQNTGRCIDDTDEGGFRTFECNETTAQRWK